jgi:hypothetical protein
MPRIQGTTNAQSTFLRAFRKSPTGPTREQWPNPAILRKWLRRPAFRTALHSLRETLRFQVDFHLALTAAQAAQKFTNPPHGSGLSTHDFEKLLRLAHLRQRFPTEPKLDSPATFSRRNRIRAIEERLDILKEERDDFLNYDRDEAESKEIENDPEKRHQDNLRDFDQIEQQLLEELDQLKNPNLNPFPEARP